MWTDFPIVGTVLNFYYSNGVLTIKECITVSNVVCVAWNIRGGLIKRRKEITNLLKKERIDVVFLTECDIRHIGEKNPYNIEGYKTFYPLIENDESKIRIIGLVQEDLAQYMMIRHDLMSEAIATLWLQVTRSDGRRVLMCGVYREWDHEGRNSMSDQSERLDVLTMQLDKGTLDSKSVVVLGDINLCSNQWNEPSYRLKSVYLYLYLYLLLQLGGLA